MRRSLVARFFGFLVFVFVLEGCLSPAGPVELQEVSLAKELKPVRAGVGVEEFTPPLGYPLGGYGGRQRRVEWPFMFGFGWHGKLSLEAHQWWHETGDGREADMLAPATGVHDPLRAKAVFLSGGGAPVAICRIDAIGTTAELTEQVWLGVKDLGIPRSGILLAATHTHSGVGAFMRAPFARLIGSDNYRPEIVQRIAKACIRAIRSAEKSARSVSLGFGYTKDQGPDGVPVVAINRRAERVEGTEPNDFDPTIGILRIDDRNTNRPVAILVNYAVHPTVLGPANHHYSSDLVGPFEEALQNALPNRPEVLFLNGAEGNIGPRTIESKTNETTTGEFEETVRLGRLFAELVKPAVSEIPMNQTAAISSARAERDMGTPTLVLVAGDREAFFKAEEYPWVALAQPLSFPVNALVWVLGIWNARVALYPNGTAGIVAYMSGYAETTRFPFHAISIRTPRGRTLFSTVPGEPTHKVGEQLKRLGKKAGAGHTWVIGLANGSLSYVADEETYMEGSYEAVNTVFGRDTAKNVVEAAQACMRAVMSMSRSNTP